MDKFDFSGYATKNNLKCADGRTIRKDAFIECDGMTVPLVWGHKHDDPGKILGHAVLENRDDGVYTYGTFNDTEAGRNAKELVRHGDVKALSIYANQLVQKGGDVLHGMIREVSLVLAGANPGARIEELSFEHSYDEDSEDFDALLFSGENIIVEHSEKPELQKEEVEKSDELEPEKEEVEKSDETESQEEVIEHSDSSEEKKDDEKEDKNMADNTEKKTDANEKTVADVFNSLNEDQKNVVYFMIGKALEDAGVENNTENKEEEPKVAHNVFENDSAVNTIMHDAMAAVIADGPKYGSLQKSYEHHMTDGALAHAIDTTGMTVPAAWTPDGSGNYATGTGYGINGIDYLFPDARTLSDIPEFIKRDTDWVDVVLGGVHKTPFSRIKTIFANITEDEARAKGYIKGNQKKDEFFGLMKRVTTPQTIYKKQKFDRDDIIDITDMNVVAWVKTEMRMMLNEELARAILIGDGRAISSDDKISETNIRPIVSDADLFTIKKVVTAGQNDEETAKNAIKASLRARKDYKGSGNPIFFTTEDWLTSMLLIEDSIGRRLYITEAEVASAIRARKIVTSPILEGYTDGSGRELIGIFVNLNDYNVGTDKGGEVNLFDDFDIDFNQFKYLIETRCSGALIKPYAAIALFKSASGATTTT